MFGGLKNVDSLFADKRRCLRKSKLSGHEKPHIGRKMASTRRNVKHFLQKMKHNFEWFPPSWRGGTHLWQKCIFSGGHEYANYFLFVRGTESRIFLSHFGIRWRTKVRICNVLIKYSRFKSHLHVHLTRSWYRTRAVCGPT